MANVSNKPSDNGGVFVRDLHPGMGQAVAERTILRKVENADGTKRFETWGEVARRVALGNYLLDPEHSTTSAEFDILHRHIAKGTLLMSGRHLQHGDETQPERNQEVYTNCSTAAASFILFQLLLNGSGVGRSYDDSMMIVNWNYSPNLRVVLDTSHADFDWNSDESLRDAKHKYQGENVIWHTVDDSREGWAKAIEVYELLTYQKVYVAHTLVLDFSQVRPRGAPIKGMQGRPSSGPKPLMGALMKVASLKGAGMKPWKQALYVDHYAAECVLVGGARRAARMSTKYWRDKDILEFIQVKRPIEFYGKTVEEIAEVRAKGSPFSFLWSSNNSVMVDEEFWGLVKEFQENSASGKRITKDARQAWNVLTAICEAAYGDGNGEPGLINADRLTRNDEGWSAIAGGDFVGSKKYQVEEETKLWLSRLAKIAHANKHTMITNPCGEITLSLLGGYCTIADVVPYHADTLEEAEEAIRAAVRALIRVNTMDCLYRAEVNRTNRIGVGLTGVHEFAWKFFKVGFHDLINPDFDNIPSRRLVEYGAPRGRSAAFWLTLQRFSDAAKDEAASYARKLGVTTPHTVTTIKPAGCRPWNALVTTDEGLLTNQEIFADHPDGEIWGDVTKPVFAIQGKERRQLTRTFDNGEAEVFRVRMTYGLTVESTADHPWFVTSYIPEGKKFGDRIEVNNWVKTSDLNDGHVIQVQPGIYDKVTEAAFRPLKTFALRMRGKSNPIRQPEFMTPDIAWLLGYLWGDGSMSPLKYRLRWIDRNEVNLRKANRILVEAFNIEGRIAKEPKKDASTLEVGNVELWHWLIVNDVFKYYAGDIDQIPKIVRASSRESVLAFIAGLLDADGAIMRGNDKTVTLATADEGFGRHVQNVGWAVGAAFGMSHNTMGANWQQKRKSIFLMTLSAATTPDATALLVKHSNKMRAADAEPLEWRNNAKGAKRRTLGRVEKVESIGIMPTYDAEVDDNHWFYAGAVKSHNTTSKLFGLTEGWHLPSKVEYLRWVQFRSDDPLVEDYKSRGYPTRELKTYSGTTIVGFPTRPTIGILGMGDELVTATQATPEEHYKWLKLGEEFWIGKNQGNQISYTLAYDPKTVAYEEFRDLLITHQSQIRCCSVLPITDTSSFEYTPEEIITKAKYEELTRAIITESNTTEDIDFAHLECGTGGCPIDFNDDKS